MYFSPKKLVLGAVCLLSTGFAAADDCSSGPWTDVTSTGGGGGGAWCATKWKAGIVITGVEVWASSDAVHGLQFYYSDGTDSGLIGHQDSDKHDRLDWDPSTDTIDQLKTWGNGQGQYLGRVYIHTKSGKQLDVGKDTNGQDTFETAIASGIMLGAFGGSGDVIDYAGFIFLKSTIAKIDESDVTFSETPEDLNARKEGLQTVVLQYADHTNNNADGNNETYTFSNTETRTVSKKFSSTASNTFGFSNAVELSGKILDLGASDTTTLSYEYSKATTEESSVDQTVTLAYSVSTALKPGQQVFCRATAMSGTYKGDYTSTVNIWLADGTTFSFASGGTLDQINWSQASSICQDTDFAPSTKREVQTIEGKKAKKFIA